MEILSQKAPFSLPNLPFAKTELEPHMSAETFSYHHEKHHKAYVDNLNNLIKGTEFESQTLKEIIINTAGKSSFSGIFNNAAQVYNHTFFWHSLKKDGGGEPLNEVIKDLIKSSFPSYEDFKNAFKNAGATQFGSGWAWAVMNKTTKKIEIVKTLNAETPLTNPNLVPLVTVDVWEHAYYLDYQNRRPDYLEIFIKNLLNWDFVLKNLDSSK
jgi:Fe-Mn family superoxide dismutase